MILGGTAEAEEICEDNLTVLTFLEVSPYHLPYIHISVGWSGSDVSHSIKNNKSRR